VDKVRATLRTLGILLGLWVLLALVGIIAGVIPWDGSPPASEPSAEPQADAGTDAGRADAPTEASDAGVTAVATDDPSGDPPSGDEPSGDEPTDPTEPTVDAATVPALVRHELCPAGADPSLAAGQLFGDERPELIVGCADHWEVVAVSEETPVRIASFRAPAAPAGHAYRTGPAAVGDVDGDGAPDLVLPLAFDAQQGASRGGALHWIPRDGFGGIREPVALAPIAAVDASMLALDAQPGAELLALHRGSAVGQVPSEVWIFGGGAAPSRRTSVPVGLGGAALRTADVNRDGHADLVALARDRVTLALGDGAAGFPSTRTFELPGAREIALGDVDGDGGTDVVVLGNGLRWYRGGELDAMEPRVIEDVPPNLRGLALVDTNADGALDLVGWDHPRLVVLRQTDGGFVTEPALTLSGALGPRRLLVLDLDADGAVDDLVLLGTTEGEGPLELVLILDAFGRGDVTTDAAAQPLPNGPIVLTATLPSAG
jgi:hypothetical protein